MMMRLLRLSLIALAATALTAIASAEAKDFAIHPGRPTTFCALMGIPDADRETVFRLGNALADVESRTAAKSAR